MPYTVEPIRELSATDLETYIRLVRQSGLEVANLPRVPDPCAGRYWLAVWDEFVAADTFRAEVSTQTDEVGWRVVEVSGPTTEGPLGPLIIRLIRQHGQYLFSIGLIGRHLIRVLHPDALTVGSLAIPAAFYNELRAARRDFFPTLARTILPTLTGVTAGELSPLGYAVMDTDSEQWLHYTPPAELSSRPLAAA